MDRGLYIGALLRASTAIAAATAIACGGPSEDDVRRAQAEYDLGVGLMHEQNVAGAFQHLQEAVRLDPDNAEAHLLLGNLYLLRQDFPRSEHHLREALRANASLGSAGIPALDGEANNSLGVLYIHMHRYEDAVTVLRAATADLVYRTPTLAWANLGWAYLELHDYPQALEALTQSTALQPLNCSAWFRAGQVHVAMGEADASHFERADEALTRALEVDDEGCRALQDAWRLRGEVRARLGRHEDAVSDFERCVELARDTEAGRACGAFLSSGALSGGESSSRSDASGFLEASP